MYMYLSFDCLHLWFVNKTDLPINLPNICIAETKFASSRIHVQCTHACEIFKTMGLFTWREEDSRRGNAEIYMQKFWSGWLPSGEGEDGIKKYCWPLAAECPVATMFVFLSLVLGSSEQRECTWC